MFLLPSICRLNALVKTKSFLMIKFISCSFKFFVKEHIHVLIAAILLLLYKLFQHLTLLKIIHKAVLIRRILIVLAEFVHVFLLKFQVLCLLTFLIIIIIFIEAKGILKQRA